MTSSDDVIEKKEIPFSGLTTVSLEMGPGPECLGRTVSIARLSKMTSLDDVIMKIEKFLEEYVTCFWGLKPCALGAINTKNVPTIAVVARWVGLDRFVALSRIFSWWWPLCTTFGPPEVVNVPFCDCLLWRHCWIVRVMEYVLGSWETNLDSFWSLIRWLCQFEVTKAVDILYRGFSTFHYDVITWRQIWQPGGTHSPVKIL